jgi:hypothetical protein
MCVKCVCRQQRVKSVLHKPALNAYAASNALSALAALGFQGLSVGDLHKLYKSDEYEEELSVMAEVSAYCRVARTVESPPFILLTGGRSPLSSWHIMATAHH